MDFLRLTDILPYRRQRFSNNNAFAFIRHGTLHYISTTQAIDIIDSLSKAIIKAGIRPGDRVILMAEHNHPQWVFHDLALLGAGAIVVPVHATATEDEIDWILNETSSRYAFTSGESLKIKLSQKNLKVWCFEGPEALPLLPERSPEPEVPVTPDTALATIIYTSGASGVPKGVMLSHHNIVSNIKSVLTLVPIEARHRVLSFLPLSHVFERMVTYAYLATGACIYYPEHAGTLMRDFRICQPHYFTAVPRVLEKFYSGIRHNAMKQAALRQSLFNWAVKTGQAFHTGNALSPFYRLQLLLANLLVFRHWRKALGGHVQGIIVGAAALSPSLARLFSAAGLPVREGYGLSECAPVVSFNRFEPGGCRFGTVGIPIPGLSVKIDQADNDGEGEILVKGPNVMMGYFGQPEASAEAVDAEGWLHTGDIGRIVHKRFLQITDRKKDVFKISNGRYVAPQVVEKLLLESPYIDNCLVAGADKPFVVAIILPDFDLLKNWCDSHQVHWTSPQFMALHPKVIQFMQSQADLCCSTLPAHHRVKKIILVHESWTDTGGQLTPTMKLRRNVLLQQYHKDIAALYR